MHVELPIGAIIAALIVLVPLPWHWRARNIPTLSIIAWLFVSNVIYAVNTIVWADNVNFVIPLWCDIVTKIQVGATMALPACCLCLCIHLERISSVRTAQTTAENRRRRMIFDILMCWILPMIYMALHYIVQGHRYDIVENFGCRPAIFTSIESLIIIWALPLIAVTLTFIYSALALRHFFLRRITFARHLQGSNSALSTSRYFRLISMAIVQMFWSALLIIINIWFTCKNGLRPWTSWADVHSNFSRVAAFPALLIPPEVLRWTFFTWWSIPISSVLFFLFFSFGEDAVREYRACLTWVARAIFRRKAADTKLLKLPSFVHRTTPKASSKTLFIPGWQKFSESTIASPQSSLPEYTVDISKAKRASLSSSTIAGEHELHAYPYDTETLGGLTPTTTCSSPPEYYSPHRDIHSEAGPSTPQSSRLSLETLPSPRNTLHNTGSRAHIFISDAHYEPSTADFPRSPSPAPFADMVAAPHDHSFPPTLNPARSLEAIRVTIYTHSEFTDAP